MHLYFRGPYRLYISKYWFYVYILLKNSGQSDRTTRKTCYKTDVQILKTRWFANHYFRHEYLGTNFLTLVEIIYKKLINISVLKDAKIACPIITMSVHSPPKYNNL